jgi:hypothetical protein
MTAPPAWATGLLDGVDRAEVIEGLKRTGRDLAWFSEHRTRLRREHPDEFVAVHDQRIVASGRELAEVRAKIGKSGLDPGKCVIQLVTSEDFIWLLQGMTCCSGYRSDSTRGS